MQSPLVTRREAAELSGTSESTVKKAVDSRVIPARRRGAQSCIDYQDVAVLTMLGHLTDLRLRAAFKRRVRDWVREPGAADELKLTMALYIRRVDDVDRVRELTERYVRLRDEWIVRDSQVKGGEPVIKGSRVSVHTLASRIAAGEDPSVLDEDFPQIPPEAREVAVLYARANPRRGRPPRASRAA
jgi:excisionase family DNA binding protein